MRDPAKTRETLLDTAIELIWQSNYDSVGVNDICSRAGVTKGAFYHHFHSKADLYRAASDHYWEGMRKHLDALYSPSYSSLEQLENLITFVIARQGGENVRCPTDEGAEDPLKVVGCPFFTCGGQVGVGEEKVRQAAVDMAEHGIRYYKALVRGLKGEGVLEGDPDPEQVGRLLFQYTHGVLIYGQVMNDLATVRADLREGFYRLLDLKAQYWRQPAESEPQAAI